MSSIAALELEAECLRDELQSFKVDARLKKRDLDAAHHTIRALEQKALLGEQAARIGKEIRMRYLEEHRLRMNLKVTANRSRSDKTGHRAAHRGPALVHPHITASYHHYCAVLDYVRLFRCSGNRKPSLRLESGGQEDAVLLVLSTWVAS
jgi:hypothetical protein